VLGFLGTKSNLEYGTAKQQFARDIQPDQLAYTSGCLEPCDSHATSESLVDHGRTPARFGFFNSSTLRIAKTMAELIGILTSVKRPRYTFEISLPTR